MNRFSIALVVGSLAIAMCITAAASSGTSSQAQSRIAERMAALPIPFVRNEGQIADEAVAYYARLATGTVFVTRNGDIVYSLVTPSGEPAARWAFRERLLDANANALRPLESLPTGVNLFLGNRPESWRLGLEGSRALAFGEVYPGVRMELHASAGNVEKLFHVGPGADVSQIRLELEGGLGNRVDEQGRLHLSTGLGDVVFTAPVAYQEIDGKRYEVEVAYKLDSRGYGFAVGEYSRDQELVIDPLLASTFIGGHNPSPPGNYDDDIIYSVLPAGDYVYVGGATQSPDFPGVMGYDVTLTSGFPDGFIAKLDSELTTVIAATFIGADWADSVRDMALDNDGNLVAVGQAGTGFPVTGGAYTYNGSSNVAGGFVAKFSPDLDDLLASSVPTPGSYPVSLELGNGGIYFGGSTNNPNFPITPGAYRSSCCPAGSFGIREYDGFAGKLSADLGTLEALTYLGGNIARDLAVAEDGTVFVVDGSDYAITGYVARMDAQFTDRLAYLSYYPGSSSGSSRTYFNSVSTGNGGVYVAGQTYMYDLPATEGAFDESCGTDGLCDGVGELLVPVSDGFVAMYSYDLQDTLALTYLGASGDESVRSIQLAPDGSVLVAGETTSPDFPVENAPDPLCGTDGECDPVEGFGGFLTPVPDAFLGRLDASLSAIEFGTFLGGSGDDRIYAIGIDGAGAVYVAGNTDSTDFPTTTGALDSSYNGGTSDAIIAKYDTGAGGGSNIFPVSNAGPDIQTTPGALVVLDGTRSHDPDGQIVHYHWSVMRGDMDLFDGNTSVAWFDAPDIPSGKNLSLVFRLTVTDDQGASTSDDVEVFVARSGGCMEGREQVDRPGC